MTPTEKDLRDSKNTAAGVDQDYRNSCQILNRKKPWFSWFALKINGKRQEYFVGRKRETNPSVLPYNHALVQEVYYDKGIMPGEVYDFNIPQFRALENTKVLGKGLVVSGERSVQKLELTLPGKVHMLFAQDGEFVLEGEADARLLEEQTQLPDVLGLLTKEQMRLITRSSNQPLIIQGRAGSGKTTVALYRLSTMVYPPETARARPLDPGRVLYVMFNKALSNFVKSSLEEMELGDVVQDTFHGWALEEIRKAYKRAKLQPKSDSSLPGSDTAGKLKKRVEILGLIEEYIQNQESKVFPYLQKYLAPNDHEGHWLGRYRSLTAAGVPIAQRLARLRRESLRERNDAEGVEKAQLHEIYEVFRRTYSRMSLYKKDLRNLLTNGDLLRKHFPNDPAQSLQELVQYQRALQGTKKDPNEFISFDDFALLLYLIQRKHGGLTDAERDDELHFYEHLVIDEAQDFGAIELKVLFNAIKSRTGVTVVGDVNQKILHDKNFVGWEKLAEELGLGRVQVEQLEVSHRSTFEVMRIANDLLGSKTTATKRGPLPTWSQVQNSQETVDQIEQWIRARFQEHPKAHVCVVCHSRQAAKSLVNQLEVACEDLKETFPVRLGHNKDFTFGAGVSVASYRQVKGLEFDTVIVVEPVDDRWHYPQTDAGRKRLYTVLTRAQERLYLVGEGPLTPLLEDALSQGWFEVAHQPGAVPIVFEDDEDEPF